MSDCPYNRKADEIIKKLIVQTTWGKESTDKSLLRDLFNEVSELERGVRNGDIVNCFEEVADVLMLTLCILCKLNPDEQEYLSKVIGLMNEKISRRYKQVLPNHGSAKELDIAEETEIWKQAKKDERQTDLLFCSNPSCKFYCVIGDKNLVKDDTDIQCISCNLRFKISQKNALFGELRKNRKKYLTQIGKILLDGGSITPELISENNEELKAFTSYVLPNPQKLLAFTKYIEEHYQTVTTDQIESFSAAVSEIPLFCNPSVNLVNRFVNELKKNTKTAKEYFSLGEIGQIQNQLLSICFPLVKSVDKELTFSAKSWDKQLTKKLLLLYDESRIIECMAIVHLKGEDVRDLTFEVSNMYGCPARCAFCATGKLAESYTNLAPLDFIRQLNNLKDETGYNPNDFTNFYVSFAGMGEPSLLYKDISLGMLLIEDVYPNVEFNIATIGFDLNCFPYWESRNHRIRTIQVPYYSNNLDDIRSLVKNVPKSYSLKDVLESAIQYKRSHQDCRIKVNYIVMIGYNDSDSDISKLCLYLEDFKKEVEIKVSYLNETVVSKKNGLFSPREDRMHEIQKNLTKKGFTAYVFGTPENPILGCGQLVQTHSQEEKNEI